MPFGGRCPRSARLWRPSFPSLSRAAIPAAAPSAAGRRLALGLCALFGRYRIVRLLPRRCAVAARANWRESACPIEQPDRPSRTCPAFEVTSCGTLGFLLAALACAAGRRPTRARARARRSCSPPKRSSRSRTEPRPKPPVITAVAVAPGGEHVATAGDDHVVRIWSTSRRRPASQAQWPCTTGSAALAFSPDGQTLASAGDDHQIVLWNAADRQEAGGTAATSARDLFARLQPRRQHDWPPWASSRRSASTIVASRKLRQRAGRPRRRPARRSPFRPTARGWPPRAATARFASGRLPAKRIDLEIAATGVGRIARAGLAARRQKLVSAGENRMLSVWDANTGQPLQAACNCQTGKLLSMVVCGEDLIATGGSDNVVRVWNWQTEAEADALDRPYRLGGRAGLRCDAAARSSRAASTRRSASGGSTNRRVGPRHGRRYQQDSRSARQRWSAARCDCKEAGLGTATRRIGRGPATNDFATGTLARQRPLRRAAHHAPPAAHLPLRRMRKPRADGRRSARGQRVLRTGRRATTCKPNLHPVHVRRRRRRARSSRKSSSTATRTAKASRRATSFSTPRPAATACSARTR